MRRSLAGIAVVAIVALMLDGTGCKGANCHEIGCPSGASVELSPPPNAKSAAVVARLCVDRKCRRFELAGGIDLLEVRCRPS